jgi:hypothetical protein
MVENIGNVVREQLDRVRACRLIRFTMPAAFDGEHCSVETLDHRKPERGIHGERVNQHSPPRLIPIVAVQQETDVRAVARSREAVNVVCSSEFGVQVEPLAGLQALARTAVPPKCKD